MRRVRTCEAVAEPAPHRTRVWADDVSRAFMRAIERADLEGQVVRVEIRAFAVTDVEEEG